ncbi:MAG: DUF2551 domain-containing protein [Methanocellales archaeon]|nr:DUF2551 domain-containing protein [Methanocellales archaeon]
MNLDNKIKERIKNYLGRDEMGIRKAVICLFLQDNSYTTEDVHKYLVESGFDVSYRGISAMVGLMNTKLGILSIDVTGDHNVYSLKDGHREIVKSVLDNY